MDTYQTRPIRFLEVHQHQDWRVKIYSISVRNEKVGDELVQYAKTHLANWIANAKNYDLETYQMATLILHEGREGNFAIINWWIDENMLQNHVYYSSYEQPNVFINYSDKGIQTCVWELAVIWFERNVWVEYVLKKAPDPDFEAYLKAHLNEDV